MQEVRGCPLKRLPLLVDLWFQILFHSPLGVLFTFPSLYLFTIGHSVVFRLGGWSPQIPIGLHVSYGTRDAARALIIFEHRAITFSGQSFQTVVLII
jgi:hypothetical protein